MIKRFSKTVRKAIIGFKERRSPAEIFVALMASSFIFYIIFYCIKGGAGIVDTFFLRCNDLFMDFFNSVRDASQGAGVYTERHVIYPPMANLIYLIFSRFIPDAYNYTSFYDRLKWVDHPEAIFFICMLTLLMTVLLYALIHYFVKGKDMLRFLVAFFGVFNLPVLYMIERGNMIVFCFIAMILYAFTYNSNSKVWREIGLISLAFAFSLKLYPVIFGWFLLTDKRYKEAIRCAIYGLLMLVIPSFFFGGPACFIQIFKNITSFSTGSANALTIISSYLGIPMSILTLLAYAWCAVCGLCFAASPFVHKERWKSWMVGIILIIVVPSLTSMYAWAFLLIPMIMIFNIGKLREKEWFFFIIMVSLFVFTVMRFNFYLTFNALLVYPFAAILSIPAVTDTVVSGVRKYKAYKNKDAEI